MTAIRLAAHNAATLKLCIASAWLHGSISRGRAAELAVALGWKFDEIDKLKFAEELANEREAAKPPAASAEGGR
jgi:hypothetical protein